MCCYSFGTSVTILVDRKLSGAFNWDDSSTLYFGNVFNRNQEYSTSIHLFTVVFEECWFILWGCRQVMISSRYHVYNICLAFSLGDCAQWV